MMSMHSKTLLLTKTSATLVLMTLAGCAGAPQPENVVSKSDAVDDYIMVAELEELDTIRSLDQFHHKVVSERYIIIYDNRHSYLATYNRPCRNLRQSHVDPDIRYERNTIRARFDSIRGCKIGALHRVSEGQVKELMNLGNTPGQQRT